MLGSILNYSKKCILGVNLSNTSRSLYNGILYTKNHETIQFINDGEVKIGISDYAKKALNDIVFADMCDIDIEYEKNDIVTTLESIKAVGELQTPFDGTITEHNNDLVEDIEKINKLSEELAWLVKFKLQDNIELKDYELLEQKIYFEYIKTI